ncbi:glucans biosynthesis glucosyltransferase MdoH [Methylophaga pinxianii]|uniref:glucans biosynthesis glucosyltransferase MdoH n=1 Tax=Methylophaga pinxianii TaxID=2881052 RepID=UPI001CF41A38|nr:glucans biosynthesis glucosyltransferase MdoH [Methylophaga pinxianii]MCB2427869.1 glucans biosynthesis glucosyltransferase MdoH [Methylophaga pinxianii]UPH44659.1 glucans biosynthesis glucosyltransferase MdoH [Methylophaga pinxianii]
MSLDLVVDNTDNNVTYERALPEEAPLSMPRHGVYEQGLSMRHNQRTFFYILRTLISRLFVLTVMLGLSYYGITEIYGVLSTTNNVTYLQWLFLILFSINFLWVSFAFAQALLGFLLHLKPRLIKQPEKEADFITAILLPIYNEDPHRIRAALKVMRDDLLEKAPGKYAFFILSDTNKADAWIAEEQAFFDLVNKDVSGCPVYYRRRQNNHERKAGNIGDWVKRWGAAYEAMIVLDADSVMSADCMLTLSRRMAASPGVGLIQTLPTIVRANTLYGRLQQFANHCFGPIYAEGLSAWHGLSSNFWGHNAIIRTRAFAESSHLPILPGKPPFGGHVLSHDFIEAALLRRAGWGVRFDTDIQATFEESPPSLIDVMIRDRRWCQGNLQHTPFMFAQGFVLPTRLHIFSGLMSYLSAVFWLSLIVVGLAIAVQARYVRPEYFANPSLFPTWPVFDSERALTLFFVSMAIVIAPKIFGWFAALINIPRCMKFGGPILLTLSTLTEMIMSALYAPILMVHQFGVVVSIFRGKDSGWMPQSRDDGALSWAAVARAHAGHTLFGIILATISLLLSKELFYWLLPITGGLMLSIPLSWLSGGTRRTKLIKWLGLLRAPEERRPAPILVGLEQQLSQLTHQPYQHAFIRLLRDPELCDWHIAQLPDNSGNPPEFHPPRILAEWKVKHANSMQQLESWLEPAESLAFLNQRDCLQQLKSLEKHFR